MRKNNTGKKHSKNKGEQNNLLEFKTIEAASKGDCEALEEVLNHFKGYIQALSVREFYDEYGNSRLFIDDVLRKRLELKLITKVLKFKPIPAYRA